MTALQLAPILATVPMLVFAALAAVVVIAVFWLGLDVLLERRRNQQVEQIISNTEMPKAMASSIPWFVITFDDSGVRLEVDPPGGDSWSADVRWQDIVKVCFETSEDFTQSDTMYLFVAGRENSFVLPTEAAGGLDFWSELIARDLFPARMALKSAGEQGASLRCWPPDDDLTGWPQEFGES